MATDTDHTFDVIVIGLGPGGEHVAGSLAERGLRVLGVDRRLVGGECPYWGCIPSKMMIRAADALAEARRVDGLAGSVGQITPDWSVVAKRIREEATDSWDDQVAVDRLTGKGATFVRGTGRIAGPGRVDVDGTAYTATTGVVVNTGTTAAVPPIEGLRDTPCWTNHEVIETTDLPASLIVLGGGAIGCELSQVMARFGVDVTIVEAADRILALEEPEASAALQQALEADGITVRRGVGAEKVTHDGSAFTVTLADGATVTAEKLLVATGRRADPAAVGLDTVGVAKDSRTAPVDDRCRVTFTDPEVGAVGMTEQQARDALDHVQVGLTPLGETTRGWIAKADGLIKVVADADRGVLVGATTMGPAGGEVLGALAVAVHGEVPIERLRSMIYAYPTLHRGIEDALGRLA